jgi:hypothetical protein
VGVGEAQEEKEYQEKRRKSRKDKGRIREEEGKKD